MKISIVTPSFNQGSFIRRCLESIQTAPGVEIEHIVLDNCSTDATVDILREFEARDDGIKRIILIKPDKGQTCAINEGFERATGDLVCWLNTDEFYMPGALEAVAEFMRAHEDIDVMFGDCEFFDADGGSVKRRMGFPFIRGMLLYYGCYISSCATFVRRRVIEHGELLNVEFQVAMDLEYYNRLVHRGYKFQWLPRTLAGFTWTGSNISMVNPGRSYAEGLKVRTTYSRIPGPGPVRELIYRSMSLYWRSYRVASRLFRK